MTYNIFVPVSRPLKCNLPMWTGGYCLLCYYILFCTKPAYLTARAWPFSIDFNDNHFGCGTKKMYTGGGRETILLLQIMALEMAYRCWLVCVVRVMSGLKWKWRGYSTKSS